MKAVYLKDNTRTSSRRANPVLAAVFSVLSVFVLSLSMLAPFAVEQKRADAGMITDWIICDVLDMGGVIDAIHDAPFYVQSKSGFGGGIDPVDSSLNWMIDFSKPNSFKEINQRIVGYPLGVDVEQDAGTSKEKFNQGESVNPYDRFGLAGMQFSVYGGEWKYFKAEYCSGREPTDMLANTYYEGRLEPRASFWSTIEGDPRTMQGHANLHWKVYATTVTALTNWVFAITKFIVATAITLINLSFTDIIELFGLDAVLTAENGVFSQLYNGIFMPFIALIFILTGAYLFYTAIVARKVREAATAVARSVLLFVVAVVISLYPAQAVALPGKIATTAQAFILSTFASSLTSGDGICATDVGVFQKEIGKGADDVAIFEQATETVRSTVGCQMWRSFLLNPWVEGQFGAKFDDLWANEKVAEWASKDAKELGNTNDKMVGDAGVPMGGGKFINNWALFQISTQTDVHTPISTPGMMPEVSNGVTNDWYRVVDAMANFSEKDKEINTLGFSKVTVPMPSGEEPTEYWSLWAGSSPMYRMGTALSSITFAAAGVIAPVIFAALSSVYSIGLALLMAFAPIMLLLGCYPGRGYEVFKGWLQAVVNTMVKRIVVGVVLVLAIMFMNTLLVASAEAGWWKTIISIVLITVLLIKSRHKMTDAIGSFNFSNSGFESTMRNAVGRTKSFVKGTSIAPARAVGAGVVSGVSSKRYGGKFFSGAKQGLKKEAMNLAYKTPGMRKITQPYERFNAEKRAFGEDGNSKEQFGHDFMAHNQYCNHCGRPLLDDSTPEGVWTGGQDENGNLICLFCLESGDVEDAMPVTFFRQTQKHVSQQRQERTAPKQLHERLQSVVLGKNALDNKGLEALAGVGNNKRTKDQVEDDLFLLSRSINTSIKKHQARTASLRRKYGDEFDAYMVRGIAIPPQLKPYMNATVLGSAWVDGDYDYIAGAYALAIEKYMRDNLSKDLVDSINGGNIAEYTFATIQQPVPQNQEGDNNKDNDNNKDG